MAASRDTKRSSSSSTGSNANPEPAGIVIKSTLDPASNSSWEGQMMTQCGRQDFSRVQSMRLSRSAIINRTPLEPEKLRVQLYLLAQSSSITAEELNNVMRHHTAIANLSQEYSCALLHIAASKCTELPLTLYGWVEEALENKILTHEIAEQARLFLLSQSHYSSAAGSFYGLVVDPILNSQDVFSNFALLMRPDVKLDTSRKARFKQTLLVAMQSDVDGNVAKMLHDFGQHRLTMAGKHHLLSGLTGLEFSDEDVHSFSPQVCREFLYIASKIDLPFEALVVRFLTDLGKQFIRKWSMGEANAKVAKLEKQLADLRAAYEKPGADKSTITRDMKFIPAQICDVRDEHARRFFLVVANLLFVAKENVFDELRGSDLQAPINLAFNVNTIEFLTQFLSFRSLPSKHDGAIRSVAAVDWLFGFDVMKTLAFSGVAMKKAEGPIELREAILNCSVTAPPTLNSILKGEFGYFLEKAFEVNATLEFPLLFVALTRLKDYSTRGAKIALEKLLKDPKFNLALYLPTASQAFKDTPEVKTAAYVDRILFERVNVASDLEDLILLPEDTSEAILVSSLMSYTNELHLLALSYMSMLNNPNVSQESEIVRKRFKRLHELRKVHVRQASNKEALYADLGLLSARLAYRIGSYSSQTDGMQVTPTKAVKAVGRAVAGVMKGVTGITSGKDIKIRFLKRLLEDLLLLGEDNCQERIKQKYCAPPSSVGATLLRGIAIPYIALLYYQLGRDLDGSAALATYNANIATVMLDIDVWLEKEILHGTKTKETLAEIPLQLLDIIFADSNYNAAKIVAGSGLSADERERISQLDRYSDSSDEPGRGRTSSFAGSSSATGTPVKSGGPQPGMPPRIPDRASATDVQGAVAAASPLHGPPATPPGKGGATNQYGMPTGGVPMTGMFAARGSTTPGNRVRADSYAGAQPVGTPPQGLAGREHTNSMLAASAASVFPRAPVAGANGSASHAPPGSPVRRGSVGGTGNA
jgi:hypothetical protein